MRRFSINALTKTAKALGPLALVLVLALGAGCIKHAPRYDTPPELTEDTFEMAPNSLPVEVTSANWQYLNGGAHLRVRGKARNVGQDPLQAVTLHVVIFDEKGSSLGGGTSFLNPTYLPPDKESEFEITVMLARDRNNIKYLRLVTNAVTLK